MMWVNQNTNHKAQTYLGGGDHHVVNPAGLERVVQRRVALRERVRDAGELHHRHLFC